MNMDNEDNNEFKKLKSRLLRYRIVSYLLLFFLIITNIKELFDTFVDVWHIISPYKAIVVNCEHNKYEINRYKNFFLKLNVTMNSEKQIIIDDATIDLNFHLLNEELGVFEKIDETEIMKYFAVDKNKVSVPPMDNQQNKQKIELKIRCQVVGKYMAVIKVTSPRAKLTDEEKIYITVPSLNLDFLNKLKDLTPPIFVVKEDTLDVFPRFFSSIGEFKVILFYEAEKTNIVKSTLWFNPGKNLWETGLDIFRKTVVQSESWTGDKGDKDNIYDIIYNSEILDLTIRDRQMKKLGFLSSGSAEIVPIGSSLYSLSILDDQRIQFRKISSDKKRILVKKKWGWGVPSAEWEELEIPKYSIKFKIQADCGATGRNCLFSLHIGGKEYYYLEHHEFGFWYETDFPIFLNISPGVDNKYLLIDIEPELIISEYILNR